MLWCAGVFLDDHVSVGAANAKGADACAKRNARAWLPIGRVGREAVVDRTRRKLANDLRVERFKVGEPRDLAVLNLQHGLDQSNDAARDIEMAEMSLHRANCDRRTRRGCRGGKSRAIGAIPP